MFIQNKKNFDEMQRKKHNKGNNKQSQKTFSSSSQFALWLVVILSKLFVCLSMRVSSFPPHFIQSFFLLSFFLSNCLPVFSFYSPHFIQSFFPTFWSTYPCQLRKCWLKKTIFFQSIEQFCFCLVNNNWMSRLIYICFEQFWTISDDRCFVNISPNMTYLEC